MARPFCAECLVHVDPGRLGWVFTGKNGGGGMGKVRSRGSDIGTHISCYFIPEAFSAFSCFYIPIQHINVALTSYLVVFGGYT